MPESLTPLYHTPAYAQLSESQRRYYNQLHACYFNEQVIFFESSMARYILLHFIRRPLPEALAAGLQAFADEEARHSEMFRALNRRVFPERYASRDFYFIPTPWFPSRLLNYWVRHPRFFPCFLWLMLIQEERAFNYGKEFLKAADHLEPGFVAVQRTHIADEAGHIDWDEQLLDWVWPRSGRLLRTINAALFAWMVGEYFNAPKRGGVRVLDELAREFSGLSPQLPEWRRQVRELAINRTFHHTLYSRTITPKSFKRFDRCPEFHRLSRVFPAYTPVTTPAESGDRIR